jgi:hypothetical protein
MPKELISNSILLTDDEVIELTHKKNRSAQVRALRRMGIEHRVRPDGTIVISRCYIEKILSGKVAENATIKEKNEPNWSALNA